MRRIVTIHHKPKVHVTKSHVVRPVIRVHATTGLEALNTVANNMHYVSKGIILFTMFYCGLNYFHYKKLREDNENKNDTKKK